MKLEEIRKRFMEAEPEPEPEPAPAFPRPEVKTDTRLVTPNGHAIIAMNNANGTLLMAQENIQDLTQREVEAWITTIVKRFVPEVADAHAVSRNAEHMSMGPVSVKITVQWYATDRDVEITDTELECNEDNTYFLLPTVNRRINMLDGSRPFWK